METCTTGASGRRTLNVVSPLGLLTVKAVGLRYSKSNHTSRSMSKGGMEPVDEVLDAGEAVVAVADVSGMITDRGAMVVCVSTPVSMSLLGANIGGETTVGVVQVELSLAVVKAAKSKVSAEMRLILVLVVVDVGKAEVGAGLESKAGEVGADPESMAGEVGAEPKSEFSSEEMSSYTKEAQPG